MPKSTETQYGTTARWLHWTIAWLMLAALVSGFAADAIGPRAHWALRVHLVAGLTAALLTLARIAWWTFLDRRPVPIPAPTPQRWLAAATHFILIAIPLIMLTSGIGMMVVSGAGAMIVDLSNTQPLPLFEKILPRRPHGFGAKLLLGAIILHVIGAAYHHLVLKDQALKRIRRPAPPTLSIEEG